MKRLIFVLVIFFILNNEIFPQENLIQQASSLIAAQKYQDALVLYAQVVTSKENYGYELAKYKIGEVYSLMEQYERAEVSLTSYLTTFPNGNYYDYANYWLGSSFLWRTNPQLAKARTCFQKVIAKSKDENLILKAHYSLGECYFKEKKWIPSRSEFKTIVNSRNALPNMTNYAMKRMIEIDKLTLPPPAPKKETYGIFYTYELTKKENGDIIIKIVDLLDGCFLQKNQNPGLIYIPCNIDKVAVGQNIDIVLTYTPFDQFRLSYLEISTDIPRSNLNIFNPSIDLVFSQGDYSHKDVNSIKMKELYGIWSTGFISTFNYAQQANLHIKINSLGRSFSGDNVGGKKIQSPLNVDIIMGDPNNVAIGIINDAKNKARSLMYISTLGGE